MKKPNHPPRWQDGMHRMVIGGVPTYVAPWVKDLSPHGRALLGKGGNNPPIKAADIAKRFPQTTYLPPEAK